MRSANIFERLVIVLSRAAQGRQAVELGKLFRCSEWAEYRADYKMNEVCEAKFTQMNVSQTRAPNGSVHGFSKVLFGMYLFMYI
jgi:hypothetical protein